MIDVNAIQVPVAAISRHRLMTDGDGVTTLVVLHEWDELHNIQAE